MVPYLKYVWNSIYGPRLYRIHRSANGHPALYVPNGAEKTGDFFIKWMTTVSGLSYKISPFLIFMLYRRNFFNPEGFLFFFKYGLSVGILFMAAVGCRAMGRLLNSDYNTFIAVLEYARLGHNLDIRKYDFDMTSWPVDFYWSEGPRGDPANASLIRVGSAHAPPSLLSQVASAPRNLILHLVATSFGIRLLYPGTLGFIQTALFPHLLQGRAKQVEEQGGHRAKLRTRDGNNIDSMFVDRRGRSEEGQYLVVCCEGNAGFYEIGCMGTPLDLNYSVIGWNHPGFAGSSGTPFPEEEQNAVDTVLQYATHRLKFPQEKIILYAWSIGGYSATFAAMNYPHVKAVILDATFDHILPLAQGRMPDAISGITRDTVKKYMNLDNAEQLKRYSGPVMLIRRTRDEMITTVGPPNPIEIWSNRGNNLILSILRHRYPFILTDETTSYLEEYLALDSGTQRTTFVQSSGMEEDLCETKFQSFGNSGHQAPGAAGNFPLRLTPDSEEETRHLALFLLLKHLQNFDSTHCTPLPTRFFHLPWTIRQKEQ